MGKLYINAMNNTTKGWSFQCSCVSVFNFHAFKEIKKISMRKSTQSNDVPVNNSKQNSDIFHDYI